MKTRVGFISNSSSSSFIILQKRLDLTKKERDKINKVKLKEQCDYDDDELIEKLNDLKDNVILVSASISSEDPIEDQIEPVIKDLCKSLNIDMSGITFESDGY